ncbi:hypothetical protein SAMN02910417_02291 [Eubacterium oxidoreducens]|uniref:Uncharacterized protein n=2 Tax=Eubacterium oxidoreducens TaxID=1732 RepID=A0A1G6CDH4_EUBOX|nr:hypothetical protein SAMN02910417_02291 [Eubacterium oxidoreducens]
MRYWQFAIILAIVATALYIYIRNQHIGQNKVFDVASHMDETVVTVDGVELTMTDMMFYITYEENQVEQKAKVYNPKDTNEYWNLHVNGKFVRLEAQDYIIEMAVHDEIFYTKAVEEELELSANDQEYLDAKKSDFWDDLDDEQYENLERLSITKEQLNEAMFRATLAQKYQEQLQEEGSSEYDFDDYNADGYAYEQILESEHTYSVNEELWDEVSIGNVTYTHGAEYNR